jgi:high-affinity iron transporter
MKRAIHLVAAAGMLAASTASARPKQTPELLEKGKASYTAVCASCHGENGDGAGPMALTLNPKPGNFTDKFQHGKKPEEVFKNITEGFPGTTMVPYGSLPEEERWALVYYVLSFQKGGAGPTKGHKKH